MQGIGRWRHRKAPTPRRSDDDIQLDIASLSISVEGRWSPCRSAAALTWSRHPDLNWGPADYEEAGYRVLWPGTARCLKGVGRNLGTAKRRARLEARGLVQPDKQEGGPFVAGPAQGNLDAP